MVEALNQSLRRLPPAGGCEASLDGLNARLANAGHAPWASSGSPQRRAGRVEAHDEDRLASLRTDTGDAPVELLPT